MTTNRLIIILLLGIIGTGIFMRITPKADQSVPVVYLKHGSISESIQERGVFVPIEQQKIYSEISGQIERIPVQEGQLISRNQALLNVNKTDINYQISQVAYKWKSEMIESSHLSRQIKHKRALAKQHIISIEDLQSLNASLEKLNLSIEALSDEVIHLKHKRHLYNVVSPIEGAISSIFVNEGQMIETGTLLMEIKNPKKLKIEVLIQEYESHKIKVGQPVRIKSPIFPEEPLQGKVAMIVPSIAEKPGASGMKIEIMIEDDLSRFNVHPGNQVDLEIFLSHKDDCLYLPIGAVKKIKNNYFVSLKNGLQNKQVLVGLQDQNRIEILDGLDVNEGVVHVSTY